jgi:hypothetical protein
MIDLKKYVDSGELERKRLEELNLVGQALEQERSALMAMMGKSPNQVFKNTRSSEHNKLLGNVSSRTRNTSLDADGCSKQTNKALHGSNHDFTAQNKIRVQAGSSFNALVRALKQDLLATGALKRDPNVAYAVDKLSLSQVELIEEGGLRVAACENTASARGWTMPKSAKDNKFLGRSLDSQSLGKEENKGFRGGGRSVNLPLNSSL